MRFLIFLFCGLLLAFALRAQEDSPAPLVVPFAQFPPFLFIDEDGERAGFIVDLAEALGTELSISIDYLDVQNAREWVGAQASGRAQLIPGVLKLPPLQATNTFSDQVAADELRPAVLASNQDLTSGGTLEGKRVAIVPPAIGSDEPILDQNVPVEYNSPQEAVVDLLAGKVDAVLLPPPVVYGLAREAGFDGRIAFIGAPIRTATRHVALHESRADLMPAINDAIARMEADGRLEALRQRYNITVPAPPPEVLRIGVTQLPPLSMIAADGTVSGFTVDVTRALTERAGLEIELVPLALTDWVKGPTVNGLDGISALVINDQRRKVMDFSYPILERVTVALTPNGQELSATKIADLAGLRVGTVSGSIFARRAAASGIETVIGYETNEDVIQALLRGETDVALLAARVGEDAKARVSATDQLTTVPLTAEKIESAIALRPGLGAVRERLNAVTPGYLLSSDYAELQRAYFEEPVFWTRTRITWTLLATGAAVLLVFGGLAGQTVRARLRASASVAVVRDELDTIFNAATSGIVAFGADGQIVRANNRARHFLGGLSDPVPFDWPKAIRFLDGETLAPLDDSADPIRRAMAGNLLKNETHLMRRAQAGEDQRYVRIESAQPDNLDSSIKTVVVIDDISNEERNRQVVERKSRLDALGQLTGGIAHDFNNMLASLVYAVDLARRAKTTENRNRQLDNAMSSLVRGRTLTSRLLAFARKQPGLATVRKTSEVFEEFRDLVRPMLEAQIEITFAVEDPALRQFCDQTQLETALMNLTLNARDAILRSGKGNRIDLRARAVTAPNKDLDKRQTGYGSSVKAGSNASAGDGSAYRYVEIRVSDNGPGMDDETLARCTDPFFTTKDTNSGTGLGLAMVYGFIRQSDGDLRIYSEEGVGTTVQMTLPRGAELGGREEPMQEEATIKGGAQTILVVEDELPLLEALVEVLEELNYGVISAKSGPQAMKLVEAGEPFDLLLTDVVMPGAFGGFELARRVRLVHPNVPVLYTSGYTGFLAQEMGEVQAPLLQKPALPHELAAALAVALTTGETG